MLSHFSSVQLFATPWTVACKSPLSVEFSSKNTGVHCHFLLQGIFPTQGLNLGLLNYRQILYDLGHQGSLWLMPVAVTLERCGVTVCCRECFCGRRISIRTEVLPGKTNTNPLCLEFEQSACPLLQIYPDFPFCKYLLISTKEKKKKSNINWTSNEKRQ